MQAEIYVVSTEINKLPLKQQIKAKLELSRISEHLICHFNGMTRFSGLKGDWANDKGGIDSDEVEIWRICSNKTDKACSEEIHLIEKLSKQIRTITKQECQFMTINRSVQPISLFKHKW
jgi:hypothetical protein